MKRIFVFIALCIMASMIASPAAAKDKKPKKAKTEKCEKKDCKKDKDCKDKKKCKDADKKNCKDKDKKDCKDKKEQEERVYRDYQGGEIVEGLDLQRSGYSDILEALQGRVAGLYIGPDGVRIRGIHSFELSNEPLYYIDDNEVSDLDAVNIYDVDYVEVVKDGAMYGSRGANGVIIVHTKK